MIHERPGGTSNPVGNQEHRRRRSESARGQVYQCILETSWPLKNDPARRALGKKKKRAEADSVGSSLLSSPRRRDRSRARARGP